MIRLLYKKQMKKSILRCLAVTALLLSGSTVFGQSTCTASFTYAVNSGGQVNFSSTSTGTGFMTNYYWDFGDQITASGANPSHSYSFNGTYAVTLTVMDSSNNCSSTFADSVLITNAPNNFTCQAGFTFTTGSNGIINFSNTSTTTLGNYGYAWSFGDNNQSTTMATAFSYTYAYNGTYNVIVQITDSLGNGLCSYSQYVTVSNGTPCNLQATFTWSDVGGGTVNFTNTSTGAGPNVIYSWTFGDGAGSSQNSPSHTYQFNGPYTVQLYATDTSGNCMNITNDSINVSSGNAPPSCSATVTYTLGSTGLVSFSASAPGTLTSPQYSWSFGDGGSSTILNPMYTYQYNGTYYFSFSAQDGVYPQYGCNYSGQVTITNTAQNPNTCADSAYFYLSQDTTQASTWVVTLYSTGLSSAASATWNWGDGNTSTGLSPSHTYSTSGWYTICVNVAFTCGDSSTYCLTDSLYRTAGQMVGVYVVNMITGVQNQSQVFYSLKAYPNPFNEDLTLKMTSSDNGPVTYSMFDMMGKQLMKETDSIHKGENEINIKTGNVARGIYFLNVSDATGKGSSTIKVVK